MGTPSERTANKLRSLHNYYQKIISGMPNNVYWLNKNCITQGCNDNVLKLLGLTSIDEFIGITYKKMGELGNWTEGQAESFKRDDKEVMETGVAKYNIEEPPLYDKDGNLRYYMSSRVPIFDENNQVIGVVGISVDITERKKNEKLAIENEARKAQLLVQEELTHFARVDSMGAVAVSIAHELNQPLGAINNFVGGIKRRLQNIPNELLPDGVLNALDSVMLQAQRAGSIIHELKNFLRKDGGIKENVNVNQLIDKVLILIRHKLLEHNIDIKLVLSTKIPDTYVSKVQIEQVIFNIINNAIDAINAGKNEQRQITIKTQCSKNTTIRISITDTGIGMSPETMKSLFTPFMTTKIEGMGIGLSLCYNIIERHLGRIDITSKLDEGTTFHISLPILTEKDAVTSTENSQK